MRASLTWVGVVRRVWGGNVIEASRRHVHEPGHAMRERQLLNMLIDASECRHARLHPLESALEAPRELVALLQPHLPMLSRVRAMRDEILSAVPQDTARALLDKVGPVTWGDLALLGAERQAPLPPAGYNSDLDF